MRPSAAALVVSIFLLAGCVGPLVLHDAVLNYDEAVSQVQSKILLLNIARTRYKLPIHFTVTSSIAATFDYRTSTGFTGTFFNSSNLNTYAYNLGVSAAESPTITIVPVQGQEFTKRILTPLDEDKFLFLSLQGLPIDMVLRLLIDEISLWSRNGKFQHSILNWPSRSKDYEDFRRRALHLAWLSSKQKLFVGKISYEKSTNVALARSPTPSEAMAALDKGYKYRRAPEAKTFTLIKVIEGRVALTNYDPEILPNRERQRLNSIVANKPRNFLLVDIRPGHPGGDFPIFGLFRLRSLRLALAFVAAGIDQVHEFPVAKDPRTGSAGKNPTRALKVNVTSSKPAADTPWVSYREKFYSVNNTPWDLTAFGLFHQVFQMTVTDVSKAIVPSITIGK